MLDNCSWFQSSVSNPVKWDPILDRFSMITRPYTRPNDLKTIHFPVAHTHIANIWSTPPPPRYVHNKPVDFALFTHDWLWGTRQTGIELVLQLFLMLKFLPLVRMLWLQVNTKDPQDLDCLITRSRFNFNTTACKEKDNCIYCRATKLFWMQNFCLVWKTTYNN